MKCKVLWMKVAQIDLQAIIHYIKIDNTTNALKVYSSIKEATLKLNDFPNLGRIVPELEKQNLTGIREVIVTHWRILYKVQENQILILAVIDSRRNFEEVLMRRFMNS